MIRYLVRNGLRKGLLGGSRAWLALGGVGLLLRLYQKVSANEPQVVYSEELPVGQAIMIVNEPR